MTLLLHAGDDLITTAANSTSSSPSSAESPHVMHERPCTPAPESPPASPTASGSVSSSPTPREPDPCTATREPLQSAAAGHGTTTAAASALSSHRVGAPMHDTAAQRGPNTPSAGAASEWLAAQFPSPMHQAAFMPPRGTPPHGSIWFPEAAHMAGQAASLQPVLLPQPDRAVSTSLGGAHMHAPADGGDPVRCPQPHRTLPSTPAEGVPGVAGGSAALTPAAAEAWSVQSHGQAQGHPASHHGHEPPAARQSQDSRGGWDGQGSGLSRPEQPRQADFAFSGAGGPLPVEEPPPAERSASLGAGPRSSSVAGTHSIAGNSVRSSWASDTHADTGRDTAHAAHAWRPDGGFTSGAQHAQHAQRTVDPLHALAVQQPHERGSSQHGRVATSAASMYDPELLKQRVRRQTPAVQSFIQMRALL